MDPYEQLLDEAKKKLPDAGREASRLEIPKALVQIAGRQTIIKNSGVIARTIRRDPKLFAKYLFKELAVPGTIKQNELVLLGKLREDMIQKRIDDFIKEFVLCHECGKPDTVIELFEKASFLRCEACGARRAMRKI